MAVQYAPMKLRVPPGFQNLLEGLAREVLREQPEDIINFAAQYFKNQLLIREETGKDNAKKGDQMEKLQRGEEVDIDMNDPDVQKAATKIQASFRGHKAREDVKKHKDEETAAVKIQASFRGHKAREQIKEIKASKSDVQVSVSVDAAEDAPEEVVSVEVPDIEVVQAGEAEAAEKPVKQEDAIDEQDTEGQATEDQPTDKQATDTQPDDLAAAKTEDAEADVQEPLEQEGQPDGAEGGEVVDKEKTEIVQAEEAVTEEAAVDEAIGKDADEVAEDANKEEDKVEKEGEVITDEQASAADEGKVEGEEEQIDIDMNDPDLQGAVVKIQASFRGHKAREQVKALKSSESLPQGDEEVASEEKGEVDEKQEAPAGEEDKGDGDAEPSVAEEADESKPSED